jgi:diguanylate cyclase (GGDEF)-like protein
LTDRQEPLERWAKTLATEDNRLWRGADELADDAPLDLVVTDQTLDWSCPASRARQLEFGEIGVVAVGRHGTADVSLPEDCSARELQLACALLGEIVRLRRERRRGRKAHKVLSQLALCDPLTELPNRRAWDQELDARGRDADVTRGWLCLAIVDLDHFKQVNGRFGYAVGDEVLKLAGRLLASHVRRQDFVARLGGDEFGLLASDVERAAAERLVERLRRAVCVELAESDGPTLTASAGLAVHNGVGDMDRLFSAADQALRQAKAQGRNRTVAALTR